MTRPERREMLLGVAVDLLIDEGVGGLSMEGIAARAGVNKALPYQHFENARAVLRELYLEHNRVLAGRLVAAATGADGVDARLRAVVAAYFDTIETDRVVLPLLSTTAAAEIVAEADQLEPGRPWVAGFLHDHFDIPYETAPIVAALVQHLVVGAAEAWLSGMDRSSVEALTVSGCSAILRDATPTT